MKLNIFILSTILFGVVQSPARADNLPLQCYETSASYENNGYTTNNLGYPWDNPPSAPPLTLNSVDDTSISVTFRYGDQTSTAVIASKSGGNYIGTEANNIDKGLDGKTIFIWHAKNQTLTLNSLQVVEIGKQSVVTDGIFKCR